MMACKQAYRPLEVLIWRLHFLVLLPTLGAPV